MRLLRGILRLISFAFNLILGLFLLGVGLIGWASGEQIRLDVVPGVEGEAMAYALIGAALYALLSVLLAARRGKAGRTFMLLWNLLVVSLLVCAFFRSSYKFDGLDHFWNGVILFAVSLLALWGSWAHFRSPVAASKA